MTLRALKGMYAPVVDVMAYLASDHITPATGLTIAITIGKNGAALANPSAGATNLTEVASGWYKWTPSLTDINTRGELRIHCTSATIDPIDIVAMDVIEPASLGIASHGILAGGGSVTAFTLPAGQLLGVTVGMTLFVPGIGAKIILTYNAGTGAGTTDAFASDTSSSLYYVYATPPAASTPLPDVNTTKIEGVDATDQIAAASLVSVATYAPSIG